MKGVELYVQVRRAVYVEGMSRREAARRFGIDPRTVAKMRSDGAPVHQPICDFVAKKRVQQKLGLPRTALA
jgi:hypothetical protein